MGVKLWGNTSERGMGVWRRLPDNPLIRQVHSTINVQVMTRLHHLSKRYSGELVGLLTGGNGREGKEEEEGE
ncbi:hypothetical protein E2C01_031389 [Portunus trituberculatus]|uniref:Uncharacterized protein n=1 Tax=Portunus trituberculatus TaxID=210409 RepID=A0A5B7EZY6_PORTR|nr:hypothetical protein [Portunus trituberculatus]